MRRVSLLYLCKADFVCSEQHEVGILPERITIDTPQFLSCIVT